MFKESLVDTLEDTPLLAAGRFIGNKLMPIGKVLNYNSEKGYGFITHGNNEKDLFVHASELAKVGINLSDNISLTG